MNGLRRFNGRNLVWLVPLFLLFSFPLWRPPLAAFLAPRGGYDPSLAQNRPDSQDFVMNRVHITQSHRGKNTLDIVSEQAMTGQTTDEFRMDQIKAVITGKDGKLSYVSARKGVFDKATSLLTLIDDVVINKPSEKYEITTQLLHYDDKTKIAHCPGATRLKGEKITIKGGSLTYNTTAGSYDIGGRVFCRLTEFIRP
jgi:LPS export ABC transporter protein LptC